MRKIYKKVKHKLVKLNRYQVIFIVIFAGIGVYFLINSLAESPTQLASDTCKQSPKWVDMINTSDPSTVNFLSLQNCFNDFWSTHQLPVANNSDPDFEQPSGDKSNLSSQQTIQQQRDVEEKTKTPLTEVQEKTMPGDIMKYYAFLNSNLTYVQAGGQIAPAAAQQNNWKKQQTVEDKSKAKLTPTNQ